MSVMGLGLLLALWHSGGAAGANAGWYALGAIMALSGALPSQMAALAGFATAAVLAHAVFSSTADLYGLTWPHAVACALLAVGLHRLAMSGETHLCRCRDCYWRGPATRLHFGHCPCCGSSQIENLKQSVLTGA